MSALDFKNGLKIHREVMGHEFVERAFANMESFDEPLQQWVTEHAWGSTWSRDGLPRSTRSLVTIAMLSPYEVSARTQGTRTGCIA